MEARLVWRVAAAALALSACKRGDRFERVELPGFSLEVPVGDRYGSIATPALSEAYAVGKLVRGQPATGTVAMVSWEPGVGFTLDEMSGLAAAGAELIKAKSEQAAAIGPAQTETLGGHAVTRVGLIAGDVHMELAVLVCGARQLVLLSAGDRADPTLRRMVTSFDCHPDATREAGLGRNDAPTGFDDVAGWWRVADDTAFAITDGTRIAVFSTLNATSQLDDDAAFAKLVERSMVIMVGSWRATGLEHVTEHGRHRTVAWGQATLEGAVNDVGVTMWPCPSGIGVAAVVFVEPGGDRAPMIDIMTRARCLGPGEAAPIFPPAPTAPAAAGP